MKALNRIATALERLADAQEKLVKATEHAGDFADQGLETHGKMYTDMMEMLQPILNKALSKLDSRSQPAVDTPEKEPLPAPPVMIERAGIRLMAGADHQIEVDVD